MQRPFLSLTKNNGIRGLKDEGYLMVLFINHPASMGINV